MDGLLLHGPIETLGEAVGLRLSDEGVARRNPPELELGAKIVRPVLRAVIHSQGQSAAGISFDRSELLAHPLADWLQCVKAVAHFGDVNANTRRVSMINRSENPDQSLIDGLNLGAALLHKSSVRTKQGLCT
ncbi:MAG: hypothetical protein VB124_05695 [Burkholderia sp.]